jgi:putative redox protein
MGEVMTARATLIDGLQFAAEAGSGHTIVLDAAASGEGHDAGFRPMELLLVGLAGCTGMDVISILRKKREQVTGYEVHVRGERAKTDPKVYTHVTVEHVITGHNLSPAAAARAIELSKTKYCGAGATLAKTATVTHTFRLVALEEPTEAAPTAVAAFA